MKLKQNCRFIKYLHTGVCTTLWIHISYRVCTNYNVSICVFIWTLRMHAFNFPCNYVDINDPNRCCYWVFVQIKILLNGFYLQHMQNKEYADAIRNFNVSTIETNYFRKKNNFWNEVKEYQTFDFYFSKLLKEFIPFLRLT